MSVEIKQDRPAGAAAGEKQVNIGLNLLRIVMTFGVVLDHFWWTATPERYTGAEAALWQLRTLAVPVFMTMTFFLTAERFRAGEFGWLKSRLARLYLPFLFWPLVYFALRSLLSRFDPWYCVGFTDLLWQYLLGSSDKLCMQFWFHGDLILLTLLFFAAFRFVRTARGGILLALGAMAVGFTLQYNGWNDALCGSLPFALKYPLGRLAPMLPFAAAGFLLAALKNDLCRISGAARAGIGLFGLWVSWLCTYYPVCPPPPSIPGYAGLNLNLIAWGLLPAFYYLPFDRFPAFVGKTVLAVSKYCMGVYCVHLLLGQVIFDFVLGQAKTQTEFGELRIFTVMQCVAVWALSYVVCWLVSLLPGRFFKKTVV